MSTTQDILPVVTSLIARFAPGSPDPESLRSDQELVRDLGFDSVRLVELLLACGDSFGVELPIEQILDRPALSVNDVAADVSAVLAGA